MRSARHLALCLLASVIAVGSAAPAAMGAWNQPVPGNLVAFGGNSVDSPSLAWVGGKLYAAWDEMPNQTRLVTTARLDGSTWTILKGTGATGATLNHSPAVSAIYPSITSVGGVPYAVWEEATTTSPYPWEARVAKFDGTKWVPVGDIASYLNFDVSATVTKITDVGGSPYIAFTSKDAMGHLTVLVNTFDPVGNQWIQIGSGINTDLAVTDRAGGGISIASVSTPTGPEPLVVFGTFGQLGYSNSRVYAARFDGTVWKQVGGALFGDPAGDAERPAVTTVDGVPYVTWRETDPTAVTVRVARLDGSNWTLVSAPVGSSMLTFPGPYISSYQGAAIVAWAPTDANDMYQMQVAAVRGTTASAVSVPIASDPGASAASGAITGDGAVPYVAVDENSGGPGFVHVFRLAPDFISTSTQPDPTTATLNANIDDFGFKLPIGFRWGAGSVLSTTDPVVMSTGVGQATVSDHVTGLTPSTAYSWQAFALDGGSESASTGISSFTTPALPVLTPTADLSVKQTVAQSELLQGRADQFTITAMNAGPSASTATVSEKFNGLTPVSAHVVGGSACSVSGASVSCALGQLASGASAVISVAARGTGPGLHSPTAVITGPYGDPNSANNSAAVAVSVISVTKIEALGVTAGKGDAVTLKLHVPGAGLVQAIEFVGSGATATVLSTGTLTANHAGTVRLKLKLDDAGRATLHRAAQTVKIRASFTAAGSGFNQHDEVETLRLGKLGRR